MKKILKALVCSALAAVLVMPSSFADEPKIETIQAYTYDRCSALELGIGDPEDYESLEAFAEAAINKQVDEILAMLRDDPEGYEMAYNVVLRDYFEEHPGEHELSYYETYHAELVPVYREIAMGLVGTIIEPYGYGAVFVYGNSCEELKNYDHATNIFTRGLNNSLIFGDTFIPSLDTYSFVTDDGEEPEFPGKLTTEKDYITYENEGVVRLKTYIRRNSAKSITIVHELTNLSASNNVHYGLATTNDTDLGDNDYLAMIKTSNNSIRFIQDDADGSYAGATLDATYSPNLATSAVGYYRSAVYNNTFENSLVDEVFRANDIDTGFGVSWDGTINSGETRTFTETYTLGDILPTHTVTLKRSSDDFVLEQFNFVEGTKILLSGSYTTETAGMAHAWNTEKDGSGTTYPSDVLFQAPTTDLTLYPYAVPSQLVLGMNYGASYNNMPIAINNLNEFASNFDDDLDASISNIKIRLDAKADDYDGIEELLVSRLPEDVDYYPEFIKFELKRTYATGESYWNEDEPINEVDTPLNVSVLLPFGEVVSPFPGVTRNYTVYKYVDGGFGLVDATYNNDAKTLDFSLTEFNDGPYIITWTEEGEEPTPVPSEEIVVPDTGLFTAGDGSSVKTDVLIATVMIAAVVIIRMAVVSAKSKKETK